MGTAEWISNVFDPDDNSPTLGAASRDLDGTRLSRAEKDWLIEYINSLPTWEKTP